MSLSLIYMVILTALGFCCSQICLSFRKNDALETQYSFKHDSWIMMFLITALGFMAIELFSPDYADFIVKFGLMNVAVWFLAAAMIYVVFLLEVDSWTALTLFLAAVAVTAMLPTDCFVFGGILPFWIDRAVAVVMIMLFAFGFSLLNGIDGILPIQAFGSALGLAGLGFIGGIPVVLGFMGAYFAGVWFGYLNFNFYPSKIRINDGAALCGGFIFACLFLQSAAELAGSSILILAMFVLVDIIWLVVNRYLLNHRTQSLYENTGYWAVYLRGIDISLIEFGVAKILIINVVLALFQLYASNEFSLPIFAFIINVWFLHVMYRAGYNENLTLKEINREFIKNIKDGLTELIGTSRKDKK